jgi:very-short-patch-repair endonuclease
LEQAKRQLAERIPLSPSEIVGGFILDFYCVAAELAIEVDGPIHEMQAELDCERDAALAALGIRTLRFKNEAVADNIDAVLQEILAACRAQT